jgi:uncharacterized protein (TIGR03000 family)
VSQLRETDNGIGDSFDPDGRRRSTQQHAALKDWTQWPQAIPREPAAPQVRIDLCWTRQAVQLIKHPESERIAMLRRTLRAALIAAVLGTIGLQAPRAEARSILGIVPRVVRGVGRVLFGPWDRYYYAGGYAYTSARDYAPSYWRYTRPRWFVPPQNQPGAGLADGQTVPTVSDETEFRLAAHRAGSADVMAAAASFAEQLEPNSAGIVVSLPIDARLSVNGAPSSLTGQVRKIFSRNLQPGKRYRYELRAEGIRSGKRVSQTKSVELVAGAIETVAFPPEIETPAIASDRSPRPTTLVVHVPADAKVYLLGNETHATGPVRRFTTDRLPPGERTAYTLRVMVRRGSRTISQERKIILEGGRTQEQHFLFGLSPADDRVADGEDQPAGSGRLSLVSTGDQRLVGGE